MNACLGPDEQPITFATGARLATISTVFAIQISWRYHVEKIFLHVSAKIATPDDAANDAPD